MHSILSRIALAATASGIPLLAVPFYGYVVRGFIFRLKFQLAGRVRSPTEIKNQLGESVHLYIVQDFQVCNLVALRKKAVKSKKAQFRYLLVDEGVMVRRVLVTKAFIAKNFPLAIVAHASLAYFD